MKIAIFGMGYVGVTTAACLAKSGHDIVGVEPSASKVAMIKEGESPIVEAGVGELLVAAVKAGRLRATTSAAEGLTGAQMAIICVGTPSRVDGGLDTGFLVTVMKQVGGLLAAGAPAEWPVVVVRSTVFPGTVRGELMPILREACGGRSPAVLFHPEFLREGSSVADFFDPPKIVIGADDPAAAAPLLSLYEEISAPRFVTAIETAEMVKYADNTFHALKITFANEVGQLAQAYGVDSRAVMDVFCGDTKLNISPRYLRPGFAFGGSCLPKDLRALTYAARIRGVALPMLENILTSNRHQLDRAVQMVASLRPRTVGLAGLAFKPGTDDLRESPLVELAERLLGKGMRLVIHDEYVETHRLVGRNKAYVEQVFPHLAELLRPDFEALAGCDVVVLGHRYRRETVEKILNDGRTVVDLTGASQFPSHKNYHTIV